MAWREPTGEQEMSEINVSIPLRTAKATTWFVNSMSDLFHEQLSPEFIGQVFDTKRPRCLSSSSSGVESKKKAGRSRGDTTWRSYTSDLDDRLAMGSGLGPDQAVLSQPCRRPGDHPPASRHGRLGCIDG
jgi:hypothetical protein